ncbi:MAG: glycosyltransferase family 4 protein [Phycisphaerales bacterium]|nr:glycosyltransferase family 4 protein [Phycisphaerales bacterium]
MHIIYLHQYFNTRYGYTGTRSYEFARRLVANGHRVSMITSAPGRFPEEGLSLPAGRDYCEIEVEGINVVPIAAGYSNSQAATGMGGFTRMRHFMHFAKLATEVGTRLAKPDVVYATSTPLTIGIPGRDIARRFDVPFVFEIRDVWPQALINVGALKNPAAIWWMRRMERKLYAAAKHVVALSPGMKAGVVSAGVSPDDVTVIPNSSDLDLFNPDVDGSAARERLGLGNDFSAVYFGAMGHANGLEYVVEAADILRKRDATGIKLVLHGHGGRREALEAMVRDRKLDNVVFSDPVPDKAEVARIVAGCNVCLTIYANTDTEQSWSPNKMFDALAAGKPVLINVGGWLGDTIEQNDAGKFVDPHNPTNLADTLLALSRDAALCKRLGENARKLAEREFSRDKLADQLENVLLNATGVRVHARSA